MILSSFISFTILIPYSFATPAKVVSRSATDTFTNEQEFSNVEARVLPPTQKKKVTGEQYEVETVQLPVDHDNPSAGKFDNRFWCSDEYYIQGGPVFLLDVGQQEAETFAREMLSERNPAYNLMKKMHGMAIVWEHRYYGKSWHMKITTESQAHDMRYLTLEQSLNDVKIFAKRFRRPNLPKVEVHSAAVPWVFVGGDYAGLRAVRMRQLHPDTIFASYAATAPLLANLDWKGPSELLPKFMNAVGLDSCVEMIEGAIKLLDYILSQEDQDDALKVKEKFLGPAAKTGSNEQFVGIVEAFASIWISAANFDPHKSGYMADFCKFVSLTPEEIRKSRNPRARYWPRTRDWIVLLKWAQHPFIAWQANFQPFLKAAYSGEVQVNYKLGAKLEDMDAISREWQACTEIVNWDQGPAAFTSKFHTTKSDSSLCELQFPNGKASKIMPVPPDIASFNKKYGGLDPGKWPTNVFYTIGEYSLAREESIFSSKSPVRVKADIPPCARNLNDKTVFGTEIVNEANANDVKMYDRGKAAQQTWHIFEEALEKWVKDHRKNPTQCK